MTTALALILVAAVAWVLGHRTARVKVRVIGATAAQDETALSAADEQLLGEWSAHLEQLLGEFWPTPPVRSFPDELRERAETDDLDTHPPTDTTKDETP